MKKFLTLVALLLAFSCTVVFAQATTSETDSKLDTTMQVIVPQDQHVTNKTAKIKIEYTAALDEVRIYYSCMEATFQESDAREAIHACLKDFQDEHQYFRYRYLENDRTSYSKDGRNVTYAQYSSHVKFSR